MPGVSAGRCWLTCGAWWAGLLCQETRPLGRTERLKNSTPSLCAEWAPGAHRVLSTAAERIKLINTHKTKYIVDAIHSEFISEKGKEFSGAFLNQNLALQATHSFSIVYTAERASNHYPHYILHIKTLISALAAKLQTDLPIMMGTMIPLTRSLVLWLPMQRQITKHISEDSQQLLVSFGDFSQTLHSWAAWTATKTKLKQHLCHQISKKNIWILSTEPDIFLNQSETFDLGVSVLARTV